MKVKHILSEAFDYPSDWQASGVKDSDKFNKDTLDKTRTRDEFVAKMKDREGQSLQAGDRVFSPSTKKMYVVKRVTPDGVLFKGADKPIKVNAQDTGKKTELGHRIFSIA